LYQIFQQAVIYSIENSTEKNIKFSGEGVVVEVDEWKRNYNKGNFDFLI
jgi:hypothetical protein